MPGQQRNVETPNPAPCPFCEPTPGRVFLEQPHVRLLWDGYPISPGHALITPLRHIASWADASVDEQQAITQAIALAQLEIRKRHAPDGFNVGINDGAAAGQTVPHLHVHVIPRYVGDVEDPRGGVRWVVPAKADYWSEREE